LIRKLLFRLSPLFALPLAACEGCLDLDDYRVVPDAGTFAGGASGAGGAGGTSSNVCNPTDEGRIYVVARSSEETSSASGPCAAPSGIGVDVFALSPRDGDCEARARIALSGSTRFEQRMQVRQSVGNALAVAGTFTGGALEFPQACGSSSSVRLAAPPLGETSLYAARLRLEGSNFCTEWARRAWAENRAEQLHVYAFELADDGSVLVGGALGGPPTRFEGIEPARVVTGGAFLAQWSSSGLLRSVNALTAAQRPVDAVFAIAASGASFSAAGYAQLEDPACHACSGVSHVTNGAGFCPEVPDAGRDAGDAAADAASDADFDASSDALEADAANDVESAVDAASDTGSDGPVERAPDTLNGFVFTPSAVGSCARFESFGSDVAGEELQALLGISRLGTNCGAYVAGLAGKNSWRLDGSDPKTALAAGRDPNVDAFIAHFAGGRVFGCGDGEPHFSVRLSSARPVMAGPLVGRRCGAGVGVAATALVSGQQASLALERCSTADGCDQAAMVASLGGVQAGELVVMNLNAAGELDWHGTIGPVTIPSFNLFSVEAGPPPLDLGSDARDDLYLLVDVDAAPETHNLDLTNCAELSAADAASGRWIVKLTAAGIADRARCRWARRLD
jgi:hypothetical protein